MTASKNVALIACPWIFYEQVEFRSQQLGLGYVGAYAERLGHKIVAFIDPMVRGGENRKEEIRTKQKTAFRFGFSDEWIIGQIPKETDVIGINAPFTDSRLVLYPLVRKIKAALPHIPVVVGGILAHTLPREIIEASGADIAVRGEGEIAFARLLGGDPREAIPGLVFAKDGGVIENPGLGEIPKDINDLPLPGYDFRPMDEYMRLSTWGNKADRALLLMTSRGCPFTCNFCSSPQKGQRWRPFSAERILREIAMAVEKWGVNSIEFTDDNFTFEKTRAARILEGVAKMRESGHHLSCSFPNGVMVEKMDAELVSLMKRAGVEILYLPAESGDPRMLMAMNKSNARFHLDKVLEVAEQCASAGLQAGCFLIVAYPGGQIPQKVRCPEEYRKFIFCGSDGRTYMQGEDEESFAKTVKFCEKMKNAGVRGITPLIATPLPGTEMYDFCKAHKFLVFDDKDSLVTVSYAAVTPDVVQIETPWCSRQRAYERWKFIMDNFPTCHNVRKLDPNDKRILSGEEMKKRLNS